MRRVVREQTQVTPSVARGGISFGAALTGVVVAFGSMMLLAVVIGLAMAIGGYEATDLRPTSVEVGLAMGVGLLISQLLSYMWGGYTAGRMGRGAGVANGLLVPAIALVIGACIAGTAAIFQVRPEIDIPFVTGRSFDLGNGTLMDAGLILGAASILAMLIGGALGGIYGSRWHTKLENRTLDEVATSTEKQFEEPRPAFIDIREELPARAGSRPARSRTGGTQVTYPNGKRTS